MERKADKSQDEEASIAAENSQDEFYDAMEDEDVQQEAGEELSPAAPHSQSQWQEPRSASSSRRSSSENASAVLDATEGDNSEEQASGESSQHGSEEMQREEQEQDEEQKQEDAAEEGTADVDAKPRTRLAVVEPDEQDEPEQQQEQEETEEQADTLPGAAGTHSDSPAHEQHDDDDGDGGAHAAQEDVLATRTRLVVAEGDDPLATHQSGALPSAGSEDCASSMSRKSSGNPFDAPPHTAHVAHVSVDVPIPERGERVVSVTQADGSLNFNIVGATFNADTTEEGGLLQGIFVSFVAPTCQHTGLEVADRILAATIAGKTLDLSRATPVEAVDVFKRVRDSVTLRVKGDNETYRRYLHALPHLRKAMRESPASSVSPLPASVQCTHRVNTDIHNESDHTAQGIRCLQMKQYPVAIEHFLEALQTTVDSDLARRLVQASRLKVPAEAQAACNKAIAEAQAGKSYLHYLIALCQYYAGLLSESQLSFDKAVGEMVPWFVSEARMKAEDADLHHAIGSVLMKQSKPEVALVAFSEAVKRSSNKPGWERELAHAQRKAAAKACLSSGPQEESSLRVEPTLLQPAQ